MKLSPQDDKACELRQPWTTRLDLAVASVRRYFWKDTKLWQLRLNRTFWKRKRARRGRRTMPGGCGAKERFPPCVYGAGKDALPVSVDPRHVLRILRSDSGHNTIFDLALNGGERTKAMIVDWQYEPIKGHLLHIDLKRIAMDKALRVSVPVVLQGVPAGREDGGRNSGADAARSRDRVSAGRYPKPHRCRRHRISLSAKCCAYRICRTTRS